MTSSGKLFDVMVLLSCAAITGVLTTCVGNGDSTVQERTQRVPLVIKGVVVARSHTDDRLTIRVGRILKGGNESVAGSEVELAILESQATSTSTTTTAELPGNATNTVGTVVTDTQVTGVATSLQQGNGSSSAATPTPRCLEGVGPVDRYIFFLRPLDDTGLFFEVAEDGVPQTRANLRSVRQAVNEEQEANETVLVSDSHHARCENGSFHAQHYCQNGGTCAVWTKLDKYFCICNYPYHGPRCGEVDPALKETGPPIDLDDTTLAIAVIMSALLIVTVICAVAYIKYKNSVWREKNKKVEKTIKYLQERYPAPPSRRDSPVEGVLMLTPNSTNTNAEGSQRVIIFQDAEGRHSRQGSLSSNQYRLLTEVRAQPHRASADLTEAVPNMESRSSIV